LISLPQHIASNVASGLDPKRGVGFQTLAASEELLGTEDLRVLEEVAPYYQASRADRQAGTLPIREMYYRLPSGDYAVTRIEDWGVDPHGRAGNSLAHSLVVPSAEAENTRWDPLTLLDQVVSRRPAELPPPGSAEPFQVEELPPPPAPSPLEVKPAWLAVLIDEVSGKRESELTPLVTATRDQARQLIALLEWALPLEERKGLTFATHFYRDCDPQRARFRLVTIENEGDGPLGGEYFPFGWNAHLSTRPPSALSSYIAGWLVTADWGNAQTFRDSIDAMRQGTPVSLPDDLDPLGTVALLEAMCAGLAPSLVGKPALIARLFNVPNPDRELAEAVLRAGGPSDLCGGSPDSERGVAALKALEAASGKQAWREWSQKWAEELPEGAAGGKRPWWAVWQR
jgi:hypothetical protein